MSTDLEDSKRAPLPLKGVAVHADSRRRGVFTDSSLGLVLYYHYADTNDGIADADYLFGWNQITWSSGWPVV